MGGLSGCALSGSFVFLGALEGRQVVLATLGPDGAPVEEPQPFLADEYGRLRTVWSTPRARCGSPRPNTDGVGSPAEDDDKVLRIQPPASDATSPL